MSEFFVDVPGSSVWCEKNRRSEELLILIHGGPGVPSDYFKPLMGIGSCFSVLRYDQLGCGRSKAEFKSFIIDFSRFIEELQKIILYCGAKKVLHASFLAQS